MSRSDLKETVNLVYKAVTEKFSQINWFVAFLVINSAMWGFMGARYVQLSQSYDELKEEHKLTQVYLSKLINR